MAEPDINPAFSAELEITLKRIWENRFNLTHHDLKKLKALTEPEEYHQ